MRQVETQEKRPDKTADRLQHPVIVLVVKTLSKPVPVSKGRLKNNIYGQSNGCQLCQKRGQLNLERHLYLERTVLGGRWERKLQSSCRHRQSTLKITLITVKDYKLLVSGYNTIQDFCSHCADSGHAAASYKMIKPDKVTSTSNPTKHQEI